MMFQFSQLAAPIIQAPMAGGVCTPELVAAVANAGGLGSFGFAYSQANTIAQELLAAKSQAKGPINANFFVFLKEITNLFWRNFYIFNNFISHF